MKHINTVFHDLLQQISRPLFNKTVARHKGDYRVRTLNCWTQFVALIYAQLANRQSLRDLELAFNSHANHHYHLGVKPISRSTLADANAARPVALYQELFYHLLNKVRRSSVSKEAEQAIRLIDSTTIDLNKKQFSWAHFRTGKGGIKLHVVYDPKLETPTFFSLTPAKVNDRKAANKLPLISNATYVFDRAYNDYRWYYEEMHLKNNRFVGRMKSNAVYEVTKALTSEGNVLDDQHIRLTSEKGKACPITLRRIRFIRAEDKKEIVLISNDLKSEAAVIMALYKQRWQIELFFKWIKQNLRIKRYLGTSENAVLIQVLVAMIAYFLLRLVKCHYPVGTHSLQNIGRLIASNIFHRKSITELVGIDMSKVKPDKTKVNQQVEMLYA